MFLLLVCQGQVSDQGDTIPGTVTDTAESENFSPKADSTLGARAFCQATAQGESVKKLVPTAVETERDAGF